VISGGRPGVAQPALLGAGEWVGQAAQQRAVVDQLQQAPVQPEAETAAGAQQVDQDSGWTPRTSLNAVQLGLAEK
jgi:hypothetical protein